MKVKKLLIVLVGILLVIVLTIPGNPTLADPPTMADVLVTFYQPPGPAESQLIESLGGTVKRVYTLIPTILANLPEQNLNALRADPRVKSVELDSTVSLPPEPPGPSSPTGESPLSGSQVLPWGVDRIDAELVHPTNNGTGIKVAVLDTGIDFSHPDLVVAGNVTFVAGTSNGNDDNGHGTLVAGIIGALDNDIGVIGVAPEAALYAVKVLDQGGGGFVSDIISGIEWSTTNGMQVINMSFGGGGFGGGIGTGAYQQALENAYAAGLILVSGSGNQGTPDGQGNNVWSPAGYKPVIAVGATDNTDARYTTSSTGYTLEVMAPGVNIYSTAMGGGYGYLTGTSASSPHAAGEAALLINSGLTNNLDVRRRLRDSATDLGAAGWDSQYGKGLINSNAAITFSEPPDKSAPLTTISLSGTVNSFFWYRSDVQVTISAVDYGGSGVAQSKYSLDGGQTWYVYTAPFTVTTEGTSLVIARSWDNAGNDEGPCDYAGFRIDKTPPTVTLVVSPQSVQRATKGTLYTITYNGTMQDALSGIASDNITLTDEYGVYSGNLGPILNGWVSVEQWCKGNDTNGRTYTFRLTAYDEAGNAGWIEAVSTVVR
ncbi:MAG: hypothetical protein A2Z28_04635 [Chloroflexi bacterium RBG_16_51_9]|nr:MAG: hypothetical protein A2Z28_04635 [Chloroflexi bacterium RBG_16_51_9]